MARPPDGNMEHLVQDLFAHTPNVRGEWHLLDRHLRDSAELARAFGEQLGPPGAGELAYAAGICHDIGKCRAGWQQYLRDQAMGIGRRGTGGDHKGAGALYLWPRCSPLALLILGHHGGLPALVEARERIVEWQQRDSLVSQALDTARTTFGEMLTFPARIELPAFAMSDPLALELFTRMVFSCLVDADFLDTERHFLAGETHPRVARVLDVELWERFSADQQELLQASTRSPVNQLRSEIYGAALAQADQPPGFFTLTVPTGGGKTRVGLGFGLKHALRHGLRRVIFAVPFTSITEQTAAVYREILGSDAGVVLEHHSAVALGDRTEDAPPAEIWRRLAAENWDAPVVVTTTVRLFESLLGRNPSACRRLHNIAGSVLVLDEAQSLPVRLLTPLLHVLRDLVQHYRVTVVFCTATQPAFSSVPGFAEALATAREIAPDPPRLFTSMRRVHYERLAAGPVTWETVADRMRDTSQALAIVNTKRDAMALLDALNDADALHLSTLLCGAHRRDVLAEVRRRLRDGKACRLVATQVVEAGVDLDFPVVLRALAPLDAIAQAAGRCNREGRLGEHGGRVLLFEPELSRPSDDYRSAIDQARAFFAAGAIDFDDPDLFRRYFRALYGSLGRDGLDVPNVQSARQQMDYEETAKRARLIHEDTLPVVVRYRGGEDGDRTVDDLLHEVRTRRMATKDTWRRLQPYTVAIRKAQARRFTQDRLLEEVVPGIGVWEWLGVYDSRVRGLSPEFAPETLVF